MEFGQKKLSYLIVEQRKIRTPDAKPVHQRFTISLVPHKECYKYLGFDKNVPYESTVIRPMNIKPD